MALKLALDGKQSAGDEGTQLIRSDLLIIADGSNSKTAQKLGIHSQMFLIPTNRYYRQYSA